MPEKELAGVMVQEGTRAVELEATLTARAGGLARRSRNRLRHRSDRLRDRRW